MNKKIFPIILFLVFALSGCKSADVSVENADMPLRKEVITKADVVLETEITYIANRNTKKFHHTWCRSVNQMNEKNKLYLKNTKREDIVKNYTACKICNP